MLPPGDHCSPVSTPEAEQLKRQICFDFTKGMCTRGAACKYSHSVDHIIAVNSEEKGICFDFLKGLCARGLMCRFSHDLSNLQALQESGGNGRRRFAPICYDFVKNQCTRGDTCRYSHDYASILFGPRDGGKNPNVVCVDFTRGRCMRGESCRYLHPPATYPGPALLDVLGQAAPGMQQQVHGAGGWGMMGPGAAAGLAGAGFPQFSGVGYPGSPGLAWQCGSLANMVYPEYQQGHYAAAQQAPAYNPGYELLLAQLQGMSMGGIPDGAVQQQLQGFGLPHAQQQQQYLGQAAYYGGGAPAGPTSGVTRAGAASPIPRLSEEALAALQAVAEQRGARRGATAPASPRRARAATAAAVAAAAAGPKRVHSAARGLPAAAALPTGFLSSTAPVGVGAGHGPLPAPARLGKALPLPPHLLRGDSTDLSPTIPAAWYTAPEMAAAVPALRPPAGATAIASPRAFGQGSGRGGAATPVDTTHAGAFRASLPDDRVGLELLQSIWAIHSV